MYRYCCQGVYSIRPYYDCDDRVDETLVRQGLTLAWLDRLSDSTLHGEFDGTSVAEGLSLQQSASSDKVEQMPQLTSIEKDLLLLSCGSFCGNHSQ